MLFNEELDTLETDLLVTDSELDGDQAEPAEEENDDDAEVESDETDEELASEDEAA